MKYYLFQISIFYYNFKKINQIFINKTKININQTIGGILSSPMKNNISPHKINIGNKPLSCTNMNKMAKFHDNMLKREGTSLFEKVGNQFFEQDIQKCVLEKNVNERNIKGHQVDEILIRDQIQISELENSNFLVKEYLEKLLAHADNVEQMSHQKLIQIKDKKNNISKYYHIQKQNVLSLIIRCIHILEKLKNTTFIALDEARIEGEQQLNYFEHFIHQKLTQIQNMRNDIHENIQNILTNLDVQPIKVIFNKYNNKLETFSQTIQAIDNKVLCEYLSLNDTQLSSLPNIIEKESHLAFTLLPITVNYQPNPQFLLHNPIHKNNTQNNIQGFQQYLQSSQLQNTHQMNLPINHQNQYINPLENQQQQMNQSTFQQSQNKFIFQAQQNQQRNFQQMQTENQLQIENQLNQIQNNQWNTQQKYFENQNEHQFDIASKQITQKEKTQNLKISILENEQFYQFHPNSEINKPEALQQALPLTIQQMKNQILQTEKCLQNQYNNQRQHSIEQLLQGKGEQKDDTFLNSDNTPRNELNYNEQIQNKQILRENQVYVSFNNKYIFSNEFDQHVKTLNDENSYEQRAHVDMVKIISDNILEELFQESKDSPKISLQEGDPQFDKLFQENKGNYSVSKINKQLNNEYFLELNMPEKRYAQSPLNDSVGSIKTKVRDTCKSPNSLKYLELIDKININQLNTDIFYQTLIKDNQILTQDWDSLSQKNSICSSFTVQLQKPNTTDHIKSNISITSTQGELTSSE